MQKIRMRNVDFKALNKFMETKDRYNKVKHYWHIRSEENLIAATDTKRLIVLKEVDINELTSGAYKPYGQEKLDQNYCDAIVDFVPESGLENFNITACMPDKNKVLYKMDFNMPVKNADKAISRLQAIFYSKTNYAINFRLLLDIPSDNYDVYLFEDSLMLENEIRIIIAMGLNVKID